MNAAATSFKSAAASRYDEVFATVVQIEGGFVDNPADHGGATNHGVSLRFLVGQGQVDANHDGFADYDLDMDGDIDVADIRALTVADASALFKRCFWDRLACGLMPVPIDAAAFDQAVNGGCTAAAKLLQIAINRVDPTRRVVVDGNFGAFSAAALRQVVARSGTALLLSAFRAAAADRYRGIVAHDPSQGRFLTGWLARAAKLGA